MADQPEETPATAAPAESTPILPEPDNRKPESNESVLPPPQPLIPTPLQNLGSNPSTTTPTPPPPPNLLFPSPSIQPYPSAPSFRPATPSLPNFAPLPVPSNPNLPQAPSYPTSVGLPPPGVSTVPHASLVTPGGQVHVQSSMPISVPPLSYAGLRLPYVQLPNGYPGMPQAAILPGMARFPSQYPPVLRPPYPRPGTIAYMPQFSRPPVNLIRPLIGPPVVRPLPIAAPPEKPQTTVYIGKISPTVENDFMLSLLQLCGPVKSWKRPQDPTNGTLKGFGLYEFESPEGVLRALRLLSKLRIDGQELMLNVNQAARGYLERYVAKKLESYNTLKKPDAESTNEGEGDASGDNKNETVNSSVESPKPPTETSMKDDSSPAKRESTDVVEFGLVSDEDRQADLEILEKIKGMIEERMKNKPLPPPPALPTADGSTNSQLEVPARSKDGELDIEIKDAAEEKNDDEMITDSKPAGDQDRSEISSPDRDRKQDKRRDRERDVKREKERELERYEREREQDRAKREKDREYRIREDDRRYKAREKEWEVREKEKEHWRKREKERERDRAHEKKSEVLTQERESEDGYSKKRKYRSSDDERRKRQREKEEDMADRMKEEEEIAEAKRRAEEELQKRQEELKHLSEHPVNESEGAVLSTDSNTSNKDTLLDPIPDMGVSNHVGEEIIMQNGVGDESIAASHPNAEAHHNTNASSRKLGFGLLGSGKRTSVPSVFNQDEDEDTQKEKKMRPLVPIDYSAEDHLAVQLSASEAPSSNLAAATEFAKHISSVVPKEEKYDTEKERNKRSNDRHNQRDRDRNTNESSRSRDEIKKENHARDRDREYGVDKAKTPDNQKLLDAKQLIDMIPKTKDELFSYEINWDTYDRNALKERMKPWIAKKITEFLGEEEPTLVDYIVSSTSEHVKAVDMLDRLQGILDEEAEMFVLKMWRMLIFEIKRVETGLALRSRS